MANNPNAMSSDVRATFSSACVNPDNLTGIPGAAVHDFMVKTDAWLDVPNGTLMFVNSRSFDVDTFMYCIGEERNGSVVGVGKGIVAFELDEERVEWLLASVSRNER